MSEPRKTAIVTGASQGIGAAIVKGFVERGFNVVANSRKVSQSTEIAASNQVALVDGHIGEPATAATIIETALSRFKSIDALVNNSGIFFTKPFTDYTAKDFKSLVSTNVEGFLYVFGGDHSRSVTERKEKPMPTTVTKVLSVNVGRAREFDYNGRPAKSAIWKSPVAGRIAARGVNLEGDDQADRKAHGGPDKSVYAYSMEDMRWWEQKLGRSLQYGEFGENLTTEGIAVNDALVGERWAIGTAVFEISEPRIPCWRLGVRMNDQMFPRRFTEALRPGTYLRIIVEGAVGAGDEIRIVERPDHDLTIRDIFRIYTRDREEVERLLVVPRISESWRGWAQRFLKETKGRRAGSAPPGCC